MNRAEKTISAFYLLAFVSAAGILVPIKWPKAEIPLTATSLAAALICFGLSVYIAQPGGQVRHPEFRLSETPTPSPETHHRNEP